MSPDDGGGFFSLPVGSVVTREAVIVLCTVSFVIEFAVIFFILTKVSCFRGHVFEAIFDKIPFSCHSRTVSQFFGRQTTNTL